MNIGEKIHYLRESQGMTLEELGSKVGVGKSTVRKWENGIIKNMRRDKIDKLAFALGCSPAYLMGWDEDVSAQNEAIYESFQKNAVAFGVISKEESELLDLFRSASEDKKVSILNVVRALVD